MSLVDTITAMFNGHSPEALTGKLREIDLEIDTRAKAIAEAQDALKGKGALAYLKGEKSPDRRKIRDAEDSLAELQEARIGLAELLESVKAEKRRAGVDGYRKRAEAIFQDVRTRNLKAAALLLLSHRERRDERTTETILKTFWRPMAQIPSVNEQEIELVKELDAAGYTAAEKAEILEPLGYFFMKATRVRVRQGHDGPEYDEHPARCDKGAYSDVYARAGQVSAADAEAMAAKIAKCVAKL